MPNDNEENIPLPNELICYIGKYLNDKDLGRLSLTGGRHHSLFKELLSSHALINQVVLGEEKKVDALLLKAKAASPNEYWRIILKKTTALEECGRQWQHISPLAYAAWAGDQFMLERLIACIPDDMLTFAIRQLKDVLEKGTEHGSPLAFMQILIANYETYVAHAMTYSKLERDQFWVNQIGGAQLQLPLNVLQQYCGKMPFHPLPTFDQPQERSLELLSLFSPFSASPLLFPLSDSGLGVRFALYRGSGHEWPLCVGVVEGLYIELVKQELDAMRAFYEVRLSSLSKMISQLTISVNPTTGCQ